MPKDTQVILDEFYHSNGPCCAGCDWWAWHNSRVGECTRTAPVSICERLSMIGIESCSAKPESGHILTNLDHHCGEFKDTYDWPEVTK